MFIGLCDMRDNLVSFKILDRIIFTRECTIEIVDNIVNTVLVSLSIPITKCIDALNVFLQEPFLRSYMNHQMPLY